MAYQNLLLRQKADHGPTAATRASLEKQADDLLDKVKEIKQKEAEKAAASPSASAPGSFPGVPAKRDAFFYSVLPPYGQLR
jgi:hypothetical protein